jgi:cytoplasmic iron level regulating protein YaaA (DUF328/UPF0246 family)
MIVSPAKKLDFDTESPFEDYDIPKYLDKSKSLVKELKKLSEADIKKLMKVSDAIAKLNKDRFNSFKTPFNTKNAKQAIFAFRGDTYQGLDPDSMNKNEIKYANKHLRILSGLYGVLNPMDLIQPYRLEMGTKFKTDGFKNLHTFWMDTNTKRIEADLKGQKALINLASKEYFSSIDFSKLSKPVITPIFKENKNGILKIISFNAKRARGMMGRFIIENKIKDPQDLKQFNSDNYKFNNKLSSETEFVFTR